MSESPTQLPAIQPQWNNESEDWPKASSWDHWYIDGRPINRLEDLAESLGRGAASVAQDLMTNEWGKAAPPELMAEARRYASA